MSDEQSRPPDPLDLDAVDRAIRINGLEQQAGELGMVVHHASGDCPPEVHEQFLRSTLEYESARLTSHFQRLVAAGIDLPPSEKLGEAALHAKLWEMIRALAERNTFLYHTDHLCDRELYDHLWGDSLREEVPELPPDSGWMCHIDLIGSGSDEDITAGLRYYDGEEQRQQWARDFPDFPVPPHEDPPFDRDRLLPRDASEPLRPDDLGGT